MIIFLSCVKSKNNCKCKAKDMYISTLFKYAYNYALSLKPENIFILSAKYGVLELNDIIEPYEKTLNTMTNSEKTEWANKVIDQLKAKNINFTDKVVFLCGHNYREYLLPYFPNNETPLSGVSFGNQLSFYKNKINTSQTRKLF